MNITPPGPASATMLAPAKLTVSLRITGVRDDGYHLIEAEMVTLDLYDELSFVSATDGKTEVAYTGTYGFEIANGTDLVSRALAFSQTPAVVQVTKNIPAGAGLGGGSADAAAALRWAGLDPTDVDAVAATANLGADVPFCIDGGRAMVKGVGEQISALPYEPRSYTMVFPPFGCSTPAVYAAWDDLGGPTADGANDLFPAALAVQPKLAEWRDRLGDATGATPQLAGSGSTLFVDGAYPGPDRLVVRTTQAWTDQ